MPTSLGLGFEILGVAVEMPVVDQTAIRITEDGDERITEDGDVRIIE